MTFKGPFQPKLFHDSVMMNRNRIRKYRIEQKSDERQELYLLPSGRAVYISHSLILHEPQKTEFIKPG